MGELLVPLVSAGGGLSVVGLVTIYLLASNRTDRKQASDDRKQAAEEIAEAEERADKAAARAEALHLLLDEARAQRRAAEDREAAMDREVAGLRERVERLTAEVAELRASVT